MVPELSRTDQLEQLLENPEAFDEIASQYDNELRCYKSLRDTAKTSLRSFDTYLDFYNTCIEEGPTGFVYDDLNRNAARSLKNMVLGDSSAGRHFQIRTAAELQNRIEAYVDLGVESVTYKSTISTLLEHIYDGDTSDRTVYNILDRLLSEIPDSPADAFEMLVRARFMAIAQVLDQDTEAFDRCVDRFASGLPDLRPSDGRSASELLEAADRTPYKDSEKVDLVRAAFIRQPDPQTLQEYLHLSARDVVERYRHKSRKNPWRGELQLAVRQYQCQQKLFKDILSEEQVIWTYSYRMVAQGELRSGGRWRSQRDPQDLPEPNFYKAAKKFLQAAETIQETSPERYLKYLDKAFRHISSGVQVENVGPCNGWETSRQLHRCMADLVSPLVENFDTSRHSEDDLYETAETTEELHKIRANQTAALAAFHRGDPDSAFTYIHKAWDLINEVDQWINADLLNDAENLAEAQQYEQSAKYQEALECLGEVSNEKINIAQRKNLIKIKGYLQTDDYNNAVGEAEEAFGSNSPIVTAVQLIDGQAPSSPSIRDALADLSGVNEAEKAYFAHFVYLVSNMPESARNYRSKVRGAVMDL